MAKILFSRPWYDEGTSYLYAWSEELIKKANQLKHDVIDLQGTKAEKTVFTSHLKKSKPSLVHLNGHGSPSVVAGHNHQPMLDSSNKEHTKDKIVYARACSSAADLGAQCINSGATCYIGYKRPFIIRIDLDKIQKPLEDKIVPYTMEPSNHITMSLLKGHTTGEAMKESRKMSRERLQKLMSSDAPEGAAHILMAVFSNMNNLVLLGDSSATI